MSETNPTYRYSDVEYRELTMYQMVEKAGLSCPDRIAYEFYGKKTGFRQFLSRIDRAAKAFVRHGVKKGDTVILCLPNIPQAVDSFYALNRIGAVANPVHPLSSEEEIFFFLNLTKCRLILTPDLFYEKVKRAVDRVSWEVVIVVCRFQPELPPHLALAFTLAKGISVLKYPDAKPHITWADFLKGDQNTSLPEVPFEKDRTSVLLYSGGTTGTPKGIRLTDYNFNCLAIQCSPVLGVDITKEYTILSCMPIFHGFGLGINIHTALVYAATCYLMPTFTMESYGKMLKKKRPRFIAGVPTIFEALLHLDILKDADLSFLLGMFCGGDSLTVDLKKRIDAFLHEHGADIQVREGYGLTECVTASCVTPQDCSREGSIGIPLPDMVYAIVEPGTDDVLPPGEEGEIILTGPTVMQGYLDNPEETAQALKVLPDGKTWLYTGDLGYMDEDGFVYFRQRMKRMIITNGYNVYPSQLENALDACPEVNYSCVIGVPDQKRMHRVRAYVVLNDGIEGTEELKQALIERLKVKISAYALPREIFFEKELPRTLVGKVAYRKLEEAAAKETQSY